jgi:Anti-sigma-28 factor, FlgM
MVSGDNRGNLERLKDQIVGGRYRVDPDAVAESIIDRFALLAALSALPGGQSRSGCGSPPSGPEARSPRRL